MDFTRNTKLDLFSDFGDSFPLSTTTTSQQTKIPETDPFGATGAWDAFGNAGTQIDENKNKDYAWDPFG